MESLILFNSTSKPPTKISNKSPKWYEQRARSDKFPQTIRKEHSLVAHSACHLAQ